MEAKMNNASSDKRRVGRPRLGLNQRGQALAETGIVIVLLLLLVMGVVEFGRAFMVSNMIVHAARDGARTAAVVAVTDRDSNGLINSSAKSTIVTAVRDSIAAVVGATVAAGLSIDVDQGNGPPPTVTLQIDGDIPFILHWAGFQNFTISRSVTFRDEGRVGGS
jgi:Flp pilus assembly protein TadG